MAFTFDPYAGAMPNLGAMLSGQLRQAFGQVPWGAQTTTPPSQGSVPSLSSTGGVPQAAISTAPVPSLAASAPPTSTPSPSLFQTLVGDRNATDPSARLGIMGTLGVMGDVMQSQQMAPMKFSPMQAATGPSLMDIIREYQQRGSWS